MSKTDNSKLPLREHAKIIFNNKKRYTSDRLKNLSLEEIQTLIEELEIDKIELEIQNEQLKQTQINPNNVSEDNCKKNEKEFVSHTESQNKMLFLQSRYASMGETVGNIAHQWKQPINAIGSIQNSIKAALILQGKISKEKLLQSVETSFELLQHLGETIDTFYGFLSQKNNSYSSFLISNEFEVIRKITEYSFQNSNIRLIFELDSNLTIVGNANEFTHAMLNLILNAKKALDDSKPNMPTIIVTVAEKEKNCTITVSDNAGGILIEPIESIFDWHISSKEDSSGVGLYMTKNIIEKRFGGSIQVQNKDQGAYFTIELPYIEQNKNIIDIANSYERPTLEQVQRLSKKILELQELEKTLKKLAGIFEHSHWAIAIYIGTNSTIETINPTFNSFYGYTEDELKTISMPDLFAPESLKILPQEQKKALDTGYAIFEAMHKRKDGSLFPVSVELMTIKGEYDENSYNIANIWDLTQKKEAEETLKLKTFAVDNIQEAVCLIDKDSKFYFVNNEASKCLGYTKEELMHMSLFDVDSDLTTDFWEAHWKNIKNNGSSLIVRKHKKSDGIYVPVEISANYFEYNGIGYNLSISRNITEKLEVQKRKDDEKMRLFFERQLVGMAITSPKKEWLKTNKKLQEILGYSHEELSGLSWSELIHHDDLTLDIQQHEKLLANEIQDYMLEIRFIRKDTTTVYANLAVSCVRNDDGTVNYLLALLEDITEQKRAHKALALKEKEFRTLVENLPDNIIRYDNKCRAIYVSPTVKRVIGDDALGIMINKTPTESSSIAPKEAKKYQKTLEQVIATRKMKEIIIDIDQSSGMKQVHQIRFVPEKDQNGKIYGALAIGTNITERKKAEDEIKSLNETLEIKVKERTVELSNSLEFNEGIINAIPDLMFEVDNEGTFLNMWANDEKLRSVQKKILLGNKISNILSPEAAIVAMESIKESDAKGLSFGKTLKIDFPDGEHWFELSSSKKRDNNFIFISRDVTDRKIAQIRIEEEKEKFSSIFQFSPACIGVSSLERMVFIDVNESFLDYTGYTRDEVIGRGTLELNIFSNPDERLEILSRLQKDGFINNFEFMYLTKDGNTRISVLFGKIIMLNKEKCLITHSYEITDYKKIEAKYLELKNRLSKINTTP